MTNIDQEAIDAAYSAVVEKLYSTLLSAFTATQDPVARQEAEARFKFGVDLARETRDRAKALV
jgi:hypothetical protein